MSCKRCDGHGLPGFKHNAAGICFACGALPAGETETPSKLVLVPRRERHICDFSMFLGRAKQEAEAGTVRAWWDDAKEDVRALLSVCDSDVATRARAAFAKLGITA